METLLILLMVMTSVVLISVILLQPDRSLTTAKTESVLDQEKDGIEKFTEYVAILFIILAIVYNVIS